MPIKHNLTTKIIIFLKIKNKGVPLRVAMFQVPLSLQPPHSLTSLVRSLAVAAFGAFHSANAIKKTTYRIKVVKIKAAMLRPGTCGKCCICRKRL